MTEAVVRGFRVDVQHQSVVRKLHIVTRLQVPVLITRLAEEIFVCVALRQEGLRRGALVQLFRGVARIYAAIVCPPVVSSFHMKVHRRHLASAKGIRGTAFPLPSFERFAAVVQVVGVCHNRQARELGMAHGKDAAQITVARATACLYIRHPANHIFFLQQHIKHTTLCLFVLAAQPFVLGSLLVVKFHLLHGIGRQVVQEQTAVMSEELLAVEQQVVHKLTVVIDSAVALQFHARQLFDEGIQHGAFRQHKGIGVEDEGIILVIEFYP